MQFRQNYYLTVFVISRINAIEFIFSYLFESIYLTGQNDRPTGSFSGQMVISVDRPSVWALLTETTKQFFYSMETHSFLILALTKCHDQVPLLYDDAENSWSWSIVVNWLPSFWGGRF